jgi:phosphate-selective porin OprO and OprP
MLRETTAGALSLLAILLCLPLSVRAQSAPPQDIDHPSGSAPPPVAAPAPGAPPLTLDDVLEAGDDEGGQPARKLVTWNEYDLRFTTFRWGAGFLYDFAAFAQNTASKEQVEVHPTPKVRDDRLLFRGRVKTERPISWSVGILYDIPTNKWLFRQTQVMIGVPKIWGDIVVGRTKEGVSLNKVMIGYAGWTEERATFSDAFLPILADGVKWLGFIPEKHVLWNLGVYKDWLSEGQSFSTYSHQVAGRFAWVPLMSEKTETVLHIGMNARYGRPDDGVIQFRSRPEAFEAPFFVDTGKLPAKHTKIWGPEIYYRPRSLLVGTEYFFVNVNSPQNNNPFFHGGDAFIAWLPTGEVRVYNTKGGFFDQISPKRPVFQGGPGAWELVGRFSYIDLDSGPVRGGKFWRITPTVNWHMSDNVRLEFVYGYGSLNRFDLVGKTQFFQSRIQLQF